MNQDHERDRTVVAGAFTTAGAAQAALASLRSDGYTDDQLGWLFGSESGASGAVAGGLLASDSSTAPRASFHDLLLSLDLSGKEAAQIDEQARGGQSIVLVRAGQRYLEAGNVLERHGAYQGEDVRAAAYATNPASAALNEMVQVAGARASERIPATVSTTGEPEPVTYRQAGSIDERGAADVAVVAPDGGATAADQNPTSPGAADLVPNPNLTPAPVVPASDVAPVRAVTSNARRVDAEPGDTATDESSVVIRSTRSAAGASDRMPPTPVGGTNAPSGPATSTSSVENTPPPLAVAQPMMAEMHAQRAVEDATPREPAQVPRDATGDVPEGTKQTHVGTITNTETGA